MTNDELLNRVAEVVRAQEQAGLADPRWEKVARGEMSETEARASLVRSAADETLLAAYRPLDRELVAYLAEKVLQQQAGARRCHASQRPRVWRRRAVGTAAGLVALAAVALVAFWPQQMTPIPPYESSFAGRHREWRTTEPTHDAPTPELRLGSRIEWVLRPERVVDGELQARAFVVSAATVRAWQVPLEISAHGAVRVAGTVAQLGLQPGDSLLVLAIGRPGAVPDDAQTIKKQLGRAPADREQSAWGLFVQPVVIVNEE